MSRRNLSNISWSSLPLWSIVPVGSVYVAKIADTAVNTFVLPMKMESPRVRFATHVTDNQRVIGYTVQPRRNNLEVVAGRCYLGIFYSTLRHLTQTNRPLTVLYHDHNVRFLSFGQEREQDYLLVLRNREDQ